MSVKTIVTLWDTETGRRINDLIGHTGRVNAAIFSPDGQMVLTGGADKTARLWSADRGVPLATLQGMKAAAREVAFSPESDVATTLEYEVDQKQQPTGCKVRWWDVHRAVRIGPPCFSKSWEGEFRCVHHDVAVLGWWTTWMAARDYEGPSAMFVQGMEEAIEIEAHAPSCKADNDYLLGSEGRLRDRKSGKRLGVPAGRRFSDELARFATNGRFFVSPSITVAGQLTPATLRSLFDLRTERAIGKTKAWEADFRYVPDRSTFILLKWPSPRYIPIPDTPLDAEVAQLFAEVVTCHELDPAGTTARLAEATWQERRRQLAERIAEHPAPLPVTRIAADPWYWLRRKLDGAKTDEEKINYLDRLIAVEPTWQHYEQRAVTVLPDVGALSQPGHERDQAARDFLEAGKRAGGGYWHRDVEFWGRRSMPGMPRIQLAVNLIRPATLTPEEYALGLRLAEALSGAMPEDRNRRMLLAIARYRAGHYAEALSLLETWPQERQRAIVAQAGRYFMAPWVAPFLDKRSAIGWDAIHAMAFLAMTHHRLGHRDQARAVLADLRQLAANGLPGYEAGRWEWEKPETYRQFLREAEALIESRPPPGK